MDALRAHRKAQAEERLRLGTAWTDPDLVFASQTGTPIDPSNLLTNGYYPLLRRAGLPRLTFHAPLGPVQPRHADDAARGRGGDGRGAGAVGADDARRAVWQGLRGNPRSG
jgi:hypothetical protein